jgi:hypothetical protein
MPVVAGEISIRFGSLEITDRIGEFGYRFKFHEELERVPLLTLSGGGVYGIEYSAPEGQSYTIQVTAILPPGTESGEGDIKSVSVTPESTIMAFEERSFKGTVVEPFLFSRGDPPGNYVLKVKVNGVAEKTIEYQAYVP